MFRSKPKMLIVLILLAGTGWYFYPDHYPITNFPPRQGPIVTLGDSLTSGEGAREGRNYPNIMGLAIGREVINAGVAGNTIADAKIRVARDVLPYKPSIVIVLLGGNDFLQKKDMDLAFADLEKIVRDIQAGGAMVVLVDPSFLPVGMYTRRFANLARATGCPLVRHVLQDIFTDSSLKADQIHPNSAGYQIIADRIGEVLKPYL